MNLPDPSQGRVLVIEDEPQLLEATVTFLNMEGFVADGVAGLHAATQWMRTHPFDLLILDLGLGDGDGLTWLAQNSALQDKGVIITTARGESAQRIEGVKAGADVYLVKPVQLEELASLVTNLLRRMRGSASPNWTLNRTDWTLRSSSGLAVRLTHSESVLLQRLADKPGAVVSRQDLATSLGHDPQAYDFRRMEILVRRLRQKVKTSLGIELPLETVRKIGYAFTTSIQVR
ncbi:MAG: response regulator transcription factor [Betaproteobacteria bacterium]